MSAVLTTTVAMLARRNVYNTSSSVWICAKGGLLVRELDLRLNGRECYCYPRPPHYWYTTGLYDTKYCHMVATEN